MGTIGSNFSNTNMSKDIIITMGELVLRDVSFLKELYEDELKWDTEMNYRALTLIFENENKDTHAIERKKSSYSELKIEWYKKLMRELPVMLYFLNEVQFREIMYIFLYGFKNITETTFIKSIRTGELPNMAGYEVNRQLKSYLLEAIEELHIIEQAPKELMLEVYLEILHM